MLNPVRGMQRVFLYRGVAPRPGDVMMNNRLRILMMLASLLAVGAPARADIIPSPPNTVYCLDRQVGSTCKTDMRQSGVCQTVKCNRIKYTSHGPDGLVEYDCLKCVEGSDGNSGNGGNTGGYSGAMGNGSVTGMVGPWFLAGLFSVLFIKRRRRKPD